MRHVLYLIYYYSFVNWYYLWYVYESVCYLVTFQVKTENENYIQEGVEENDISAERVATEAEQLNVVAGN